MLEQILLEIQKAGGKEIDVILDATLERRCQLYPGWEMVYLATPKQTPEYGERAWKDMWVRSNGQE